MDDMFRNRKSGEKWNDYGLSPVANAAGGRAPSFKDLSPYTKSAIDEIEKNWAINGMQGSQLAMIGFVGYYTFGLHGL